MSKFDDISAHKATLEAFYLEWVNDFLTTAGMALHYGLSVGSVDILVDAGREIYEEQLIRNGA